MRYVYLALASIAGALLFLLIFAEAGDAQVKQTRAQLVAERDKYADILIGDEIEIGELEKQIEALKAEVKLKDEAIALMVEIYNAQSQRLEAIQATIKTLAGVRVPEVPLPPIVEINQTVESQHPVVVVPAYQPPVWDSPVYCSGYEIPVRGGITITSQNCH